MQHALPSPLFAAALFPAAALLFAATFAGCGTQPTPREAKPALPTEPVIARAADAKVPPFLFTPTDDALLDEVSRGCFNFLWNAGDPRTNMVPDRTGDTIISVAGVGFQLSALPIGVERGWVSRPDAAARAEKILGLLEADPRIRHQGIFQHFLDGATAGPHTKTHEHVASTIDSAILFSGLLTCSTYFGGEIAKVSDRIFAQANWQAFMQPSKDDKPFEAGFISLGWKPHDNANLAGPGEILPYRWVDSGCEHRLVTFLAVCAPDPTHRADPEAYYKLRRGLGTDDASGQVVFFPFSGALFTAQFSHLWMDYAHLGPDNPAAFNVAHRPQVDWWENSRRLTLLHRARAVENRRALPTLGPSAWGFTASDVPAGYGVFGVFPKPAHPAHWIPEWDYSTWNPGEDLGDGTIAPYAAASSIIFEPQLALEALRHYRTLAASGAVPKLWSDPAGGGYGFADAFNMRGQNQQAWVAPDHLAIDQGPMLLAIENARSGLIWALFQKHRWVKAGWDRLGEDPRTPHKRPITRSAPPIR